MAWNERLQQYRKSSMSLTYDIGGQRSVDNELSNAPSELGSELSDLYRDMERTRALHLEICDLMLSPANRAAREWVRLAELDSKSKL